jgi:hypothetical protein
MSKQTAVEWFFDKIKSHFEHDGDLFETACMTYAIAKEKEKEQTVHCYEQAYRDGYIDNGNSGESYYNETYGGDK